MLFLNSGSGVRHAAVVALGFCVGVSAAGAATTVRVADWNFANLPNDSVDDGNLRTVLTYAGAARPIDVMAMVETDTKSAPEAANVFSSAYNAAYTSVVTAADGGGDRTGFVYNTSTLQLVNSTTVGGITHPSLRAQFRPVGTTGAADFYYYAVHLISGDSTQIKSQRVDQAGVLRSDADALGSSNVIFGGDFNWQKADDVSVGVGAYRTFNAPGQGQVFDPVNQVGNWRDNPLYKGLDTEDPGASMNDRFDMQLISSELTDGQGLDYVAGSYNVVGNNGTHVLGDTIMTGTGAPVGVLNALVAFSDHLPVVADYAVVPEPVIGLALAVVVPLLRRRRGT